MVFLKVESIVRDWLITYLKSRQITEQGIWYILLFWVYFMVVVVDFFHQCVRIFWMIRWWYSNLGHWPICTYYLSLNVNILSSPALARPFYFPVLSIFFFPLFSISSPSVAVLLWSPINFHLLPTSFSNANRFSSRRRLPPPPACQPPPLVPAPHAAYLSLIPFLCQFSPPFTALGLQPGPCRPLGGLPDVDPSASLCPCLVLPKFSFESWHRPVLVSLSGVFLQKGEQPSLLHFLAVARPGPRPPYFAIPAPFRLHVSPSPSPPLPSPFFIMFP